MPQFKKYSILGIVLGLSVFSYGHFLPNIGFKENYKTVRQTASAVSSTNTSASDFTDIVRVVDGDTIVVNINGTEEKVRLIGVDTPETVDPRKKVQCFGKEASEKTKALLSDGQVQLVPDASQGDKDKYGRLLRYVYLPDGTFVNKVLINEGYGHEYTYRLPYKYQKEFKQAQKDAEMGKVGLWGNRVCGK